MQAVMINCEFSLPHLNWVIQRTVIGELVCATEATNILLYSRKFLRGPIFAVLRLIN